VGIAKKKENSAAALVDKPKSIPPIIVDADLDMPGNSDIHCANPISSDSLGDMDKISSFLAEDTCFSTIKIKMAPTIRANDTVNAENKYFSIISLNIRPKKAEGIKAIII
jgi:hypothetical protein